MRATLPERQVACIIPQSHSSHGLHRLRRLLHCWALGVVDDVRNYGRAHPAILVGGAMLAGMAVGRLMRSAPPASQSGGNGGSHFSSSDTRAFDPELPAGETAGLAAGEL